MAEQLKLEPELARSGSPGSPGQQARTLTVGMGGVAPCVRGKRQRTGRPR
jgi:hypothetical protein